MMSLKNVHLILFTTEGTRLADWHASGLLQREAELYLRLLPHVGSVHWLTYGGVEDFQYQEAIPGIGLLVNRWRLPNQVYIQQLPWLHRQAFEKATILKSEQTGASAAAIRIATYFGKRYIARSGFSWGLFAQYNPDDYAAAYQEVLAQEAHSFEAATKIVFTTEEMRQHALETHHVAPEKISVIPNYVNTTRFAPTEDKPAQNRLLFIGRFTKQKNILALLDAVAPLTHVPVDIIGSGELLPQVEAKIQAEKLSHVQLLGNRPNHELPQHLHNATLYVQPSLYEGHPKTIFEAMACGLAVVVGDSPGIRQFIAHGKTGYLVETDAASIRAGIEALLGDQALQQAMGQAARQYVADNFALDRVVDQELALLTAVMASAPPAPHPTPRPIFRSLWTYGERVAKLIGNRLFP